jgi:hypothetical protein
MAEYYKRCDCDSPCNCPVFAKGNYDMHDMRDKDCHPEKSPCVEQCSREKTSNLIRRKARYLRDKAHRLELLADQVEHSIHGEADEVLWSLVCESTKEC